MAEKDFKIKHGLYVNDSADINNLTVRTNATIQGDAVVTGTLTAGTFTGNYSGFDSDFNAALDGAGLAGTGLTYTAGTNTLSITNTGVDSGVYGSVSLVPVLTINAQGQIDSAGTVSVAGVSSVTFDSATYNYTISTADGGSFLENIHTRPSLSGIAGTYGSASAVPVIKVDQFGHVDSISTVSVADVTAFAYDSTTGSLTISTADGGSYDTVVTLDPFTTTNLSEGSNLYYTTARFDSDFGDNTTSDLTEGTNLYYTTARADSDAKAAISVTDAGGDGSLTYNSGVITYTGPSATEVRAHFTAGTGVAISSGEVSIGQAVSTTSDVTFAKITGDSAVLDGISFVSNPGTYAGGNTVGTLFWDSDEQKGLSFVTRTREGFPGATINVGQESVIYVHNLTGATISNGDAVYISGTAHGLHPSVTKARANAAVTGTLAIATQDIVDNAHGYVTRFGLVRDVNTGGLTAGDEIYLSADSAGKWTTTPVTVDDGYPLHIGKVVRVDATTGTILVDPFTEHFEYLRIQDRLKVTGAIEGTTITLDSAAKFAQIDYKDRPDYLEGTVWYDEDEHALAYHTADSDYINYIGEREWLRGRNSSGATILRGTPVYTDGVHISGHPIHGHHPLIYAADASVDGKYEVLGLAAHDIANGSHGYVITRGWLDNIDTSALTSGERFHLAAGGGITRFAAGYPNYPVDLGIALTVDSAGGGGSVYVNVIDHTLETLRVTENARVDGNVTIGGNLNVVGTTTQAITQSLTVTSNFVKLLDGDTLGTTYQSSGGLDDATFKGNYTGDSDLFYFVRMSSVDSAGGNGDVIEWGISDSNLMLYGAFNGTYGYGAGFDSANGQTTWSLKTDGKTAPLRNNISIQFINAAGHDSADVWCAHPAELNLDLGIVGNYNPSGPGGLRYAGLYRDVDDARWKFFDGSRQDFSDSSNISVQDSAGIGYSLANVQANTFYGALSGNASTATSATQLATGRNFSLTGDITASAVSFDGTGNVQLTTAYNPGSIVNADISATAAIADTKLATISTAGKVQNGATTATSANTASAIVARDASGNFSAGTITASGFTSTGNMTFGDSNKAIFGAGSDLQIYHDGSHSYVRDQGVGNLILQGSGSIKLQSTAGEDMLIAYANGATELYYDNSAKIATTSSGVDVTGTLTADGLTVDGNGSLLTLDNGSNNTTLSNLNGNVTLAVDAAGAGRNYIVQANSLNVFKASTGGDVSLFDDSGVAKFFWDASTERLGIGTTTPAAPIEVQSSGQALLLGVSTYTDQYMRFRTQADGVDFGLKTGVGPDGGAGVIKTGNQKGFGISTGNSNLAFGSISDNDMDFFITAAGKVGIGTSSPSLPLHVVDPSTSYVLAETTGTGTSAGFRLKGDSSADYTLFTTQGTNQFAIYDNAAAAERMRIDNSGNVGIGTSSPTSELTIGADTPQLDFYKNSSADVLANIRAETDSGTGGKLVFQTKRNGDTALDRMTIDDDGNVGIGTTGPIRDLHINKTNASGQVRLQVENDDNTSATSHSVISIYSGGASGGDPFLHWKVDAVQDWSIGIDNSDADKLKISKNFGPGTNDYLAIDTSGNVGIGTNSPSNQLHLHTTSTSNILQLTNSATGTGAGDGMQIVTSSTEMQLRNREAGPTTFYTSNLERMRIDSSGNVGIGTTSPDAKLEVALNSEGEYLRIGGDNSNNGRALRFTSSTSVSNGALHTINASSSNGVIALATASTERMRIDASGNLLVGKTTANNTTAGTTIYGSGSAPGNMSLVRDGGSSIVMNRLNSDGDIAVFRKDGATVGSIGTVGSDIVIGSGAIGFRFYEADNSIIPSNTDGNATDGTTDLGDTSFRYKDLYLSGSVVLDEASNTTTTATTTTTSQTAVASFSATTYGSAEVVITAKDGSNRHITKLLVVHNGTTASATEYGTIYTSSSLATYDVDISGGNVRLLATPISTNSTVFNIAMTLIDA